MSTSAAATDPALARLAGAVLIPPFPSRRAPGWLLAALADGLGGVTLFGPNIATNSQLAGLVGSLRSAADEPVIAIDEEGGDVTRIAHLTGSPYPGNAALGAVDDPALTEAVYRDLGTHLAALGINLDLAPSADVNTVSDNPVIGTRSFGADTKVVTRHAAAAVSGLQSAGVAACAKHFPGHGSTSMDSHHAMPTIDVSLGLLASRDLPPFAAAIGAGVRAVMPGHLRVPALTGDLPASLSAAALTGLLRGDLGFTGVIVSDALEMRAVSRPFGLREAAVLAVAAGTDLLCLGRDVGRAGYLAVRDALAEAVSSGRLPGARLEEAVERVAGLRSWTAAHRTDEHRAGVHRAKGHGAQGHKVGGQRAAGHGAEGHRAVGHGAAGHEAGAPAAALTAGAHVGLVAARRAVLLSGAPPALADPLVVELVPPAGVAVGPVPWGLGRWVPTASVRRISTADHEGAVNAPGLPAIGMRSALAAADRVLADAAGRSLVIVVRDAHRYPQAAQEALRRLLAERPDAVLVEMGLPVWRPPAATYLATFGAASVSGLAAAEVLGLAREGAGR
jgi:beta-N-acetylhexosaminidase